VPIHRVMLVIMHLLRQLDDRPHKVIIIAIVQEFNRFDQPSKLVIQNLLS